jgi:hypothetical protein
MAIDLGGIAKGYAVDRAFELLKSLGYRNFLVNAGGDLRVGGSKPEVPGLLESSIPGILKRSWLAFRYRMQPSPLLEITKNSSSIRAEGIIIF